MGTPNTYVMRFLITKLALTQVVEFNKALAVMENYWADGEQQQEFNEFLDSKTLLVRELENLVGIMGMDCIFQKDWNYDENFLTFSAHENEEIQEEFEPEEYENLMNRLVKAKWLERVDEDSYSPWLEIITNNIHQGSNLISSIVEVIQGIQRGEVELILDEIETSELFSKAEERAIISTIEFLYHGDRIDCLTSITQKLVKTYQK